MRILVTGGTGVLGRAAIPLLRAGGHEVDAPPSGALDLFDSDEVGAAVVGVDGILHLATRIPPRERFDEPDAWRENDRLRAEASQLLVDSALGGGTELYLQASIAFLYPPDAPADEDTPLATVAEQLRSAVVAEREAARFAAAGRRGVVLRFGLLDGAGTGNEGPDPRYGATLDVADGGAALLAALAVPSGIYNVCRDGERVSNARFRAITGWRPGR